MYSYIYKFVFFILLAISIMLYVHVFTLSARYGTPTVKINNNTNSDRIGSYSRNIIRFNNNEFAQKLNDTQNIDRQLHNIYHGWTLDSYILDKLTHHGPIEQYFNFTAGANHFAIMQQNSGRMGNYMTQTAMAITIGLTNNLLPIYNDYGPPFGTFRGRFRQYAKQHNYHHEMPWVDIDLGWGTQCDPNIYNLSISNPEQNLKMTTFFMCPELVDKYRDILLYEFTFENHIVNRAVQFFNQFKSRINNETVLVGIHVRLGDYMTQAYFARGIRPPTRSYFRNSLNYLIEIYGDNILFITCGRDQAWINETIVPLDHRVVVSREELAAVDMAILQACDHHIQTHGTFGHWATFRSKNGDVIRMDRSLRHKVVDNLFNITKIAGRFINMAIYNSEKDIEDFKIYAATKS